MNILALGDVVGVRAVEYLGEMLGAVKRKLCVDLTVVNGENATEIKGLSQYDAKRLLDCGVDLITGGNHIFSKRDLAPFLDSSPYVIRPANYPGCAPGEGYKILSVGALRVLCINVSGCVYMEPLASPFDTVDAILERERGKYDISLIDIHAEATSEKYALARYFDGRIDIIFGTHTHVQTADEQLLPDGSAYITDLGMCGPTGGVLGTDSQAVIERFRTHMPRTFFPSLTTIKAHGALFTIDDNTLRPVSVKRIKF